MKKLLLCALIFLPIFCSHFFAMDRFSVEDCGFKRVDPLLITKWVKKCHKLYQFKDKINNFLTACHGKETQKRFIQKQANNLVWDLPFYYQVLIEKTGSSVLEITLVYMESEKSRPCLFGGDGFREYFSSNEKKVEKSTVRFWECKKKWTDQVKKAKHWCILKDKSVFFAFFNE